MYPQESTISFSDNLLGTASIYALFRMLGDSLYTSFQLWFCILTMLNFFASYLFCKKITNDKYSGAIGAAVFTFSIALLAQYSHAQMFARFPILLAFYFGLRFCEKFRVKDFFLSILMVVYQYYCAVYLGFLLMVPVGLMLLVALFFRWKAFKTIIKPKLIGAMLLSIVINALLLLPLLILYLNSPAMIKAGGLKKMNTYQEVFETIPTLKSYLLIRSHTNFWGFLNQVGFDLPSWWDHQLFIGATVIASLSFLLFYGIKRILDSQVISWQKSLLSLTAIITFFMFLRIGSFSFYKFLHALPGFGSMRAIQ